MLRGRLLVNSVLRVHSLILQMPQRVRLVVPVHIQDQEQRAAFRVNLVRLRRQQVLLVVNGVHRVHSTITLVVAHVPFAVSESMRQKVAPLFVDLAQQVRSQILKALKHVKSVQLDALALLPALPRAKIALLALLILG